MFRGIIRVEIISSEELKRLKVKFEEEIKEISQIKNSL